MENLSDILPDSVEFKLGGSAYHFSPLTIGDLAALGNYIKQERIKKFMEYGGNLEPALQAAVIEKLLTDESDINMRSPESMMFLLYRSLAKHQQDLTLEKTGDLLSTVNIQQIMTLINSLGGSIKNSNGAPEQETAKD